VVIRPLPLLLPLLATKQASPFYRDEGIMSGREKRKSREMMSEWKATLLQ
jgi:hypothetical protein